MLFLLQVFFGVEEPVAADDWLAEAEVDLTLLVASAAAAERVARSDVLGSAVMTVADEEAEVSTETTADVDDEVSPAVEATSLVAATAEVAAAVEASDEAAVLDAAELVAMVLEAAALEAADEEPEAELEEPEPVPVLSKVDPMGPNLMFE